MWRLELLVMMVSGGLGSGDLLLVKLGSLVHGRVLELRRGSLGLRGKGGLVDLRLKMRGRLVVLGSLLRIRCGKAERVGKRGECVSA